MKKIIDSVLGLGFENHGGTYSYCYMSKDRNLRIRIIIFDENRFRFSAAKSHLVNKQREVIERCVMIVDYNELVMLMKHFNLSI